MTYKNDTQTVVLIGAGTLSHADDSFLCNWSKSICAADGGFHHAQRLGLALDCVIGDLDSSDASAIADYGAQVIHMPDQNLTDFDKALHYIKAPTILCFGFIGDRLDHSLAAFNTLAKHRNKSIILFSGQDCARIAPAYLQTELPTDTAYSVFPLTQTQARSRGLRWNLNNLPLAPDATISSSNQTNSTAQDLWIDNGVAILIIPRLYWAQLTEHDDE